MMPDAGAYRVPVRHILAPTAGGSEVVTPEAGTPVAGEPETGSPFAGSPDAGETQAGATQAQTTQLLFENTAEEETCEEMEGGFTKIRSKLICQTDLIPNQERNRVALTLLLRKRSN